MGYACGVGGQEHDVENTENTNDAVDLGTSLDHLLVKAKQQIQIMYFIEANGLNEES